MAGDHERKEPTSANNDENNDGRMTAMKCIRDNHTVNKEKEFLKLTNLLLEHLL
jgi:hypothetical protein